MKNDEIDARLDLIDEQMAALPDTEVRNALLAEKAELIMQKNASGPDWRRAARRSVARDRQQREAATGVRWDTPDGEAPFTVLHTVYRIDVHLGEAGVASYVGATVRDPRTRIEEHLDGRGNPYVGQLAAIARSPRPFRRRAESRGGGTPLVKILLSVVETGVSPADIADVEARHIARLDHPLNVEHAAPAAVRTTAALVRRFFLLDAQ